MKINVKDYNSKSVESKKKQNSFDISSFSFFQSGINDKARTKLYRELKVLLKSGITVEEALSILIQQTKNSKLKSILEATYKELLKGKTLVFSMSTSGAFSSFEINTILIGEETKNLPKVLEELEIFFDRKHKLKNQIITVLTYPAFVILITIGVLVFMLRNVVPMFEKVFRQFNSELPDLTKKIIYLSNNFSSFMWGFLLVILISIILYARYKKTNNFRKLSSSIVLRIPFFGRIVKIIYLSRFCRALSLLLSSRVPIIDALGFVKSMIGFYPIEKSIDQIKKDILKGQTLAGSLKKHKVYDVNLVSMVKVSEEVNELDEMFNYLTEQYTNEVDTKSKRIGALIEPFIIIIIGSLVGVIMIAMYLPMFNLSKVLNPN